MESKAHHDGAICLDLRLGTPSLLPVGHVDHHQHRIGSREEAPLACDHCSRRFHSKKALGGHQNAHRIGVGRAFGKRQRRRVHVATTPAPPPVAVHWLHARREQLWRAYLASTAVGSTWPSRDHDGGEAAAVPELDLSVKL